MYIFGFLTLLSAAGVIFARKPLNSALCLVATLFLVAVHFALLGSDMLAVLQVLVYAGAIMVLVIFVIMLLGTAAEVAEAPSRGLHYASALVGGVFFFLLYYVVRYSNWAPAGRGSE